MTRSQCPCSSWTRARLRSGQKKRYRRRENHLRQLGDVQIHHFREAEDILPQVDLLFEQHIARWEGTSNPSRFQARSVRALFERLTVAAGPAGLLRFARLDLDERPIALAYNYCFGGRYCRGPSSFAPDLASYSAGDVLQKYVVLQAAAEGATLFDFGSGDQDYKMRDATRVDSLITWTMYPA